MSVLHSCVITVCMSLTITRCVASGVKIQENNDGPEVGKQTVTGVTDGPDVDTKAVTAHLCPGFCTMGDRITCIPPPCPPPGCVDPAWHKPTDCCAFCPHGANCRAPDGSIVAYNHWKIVGGKNCTCLSPSRETTCV